MASSKPREYDIFLLGKTGTGKSATGNSILQTTDRKMIFKTGASAESVTDCIQREFSVIDGHVVKVVDGPGLAENRMDPEDAGTKAYNDMVEAMSICGEGFHALALVLRFGERFTNEHEACLKLLKEFFGGDFMKRHGIIVMTGGDSFKDTMEEELTPNKTFEMWCHGQKGELLKLFKECGFRVVLFNNRSRSREEINHQRRMLFKTIDQLGEIRYTNSIFKEIERVRNEEIEREKDFQFKTEVMKKCSVVNQYLREIINSKTDGNFTYIMEKLSSVENNANDILQEISCSGRGSARVEELKLEVKSIIQGVQTHRKRVEKTERERKQMIEYQKQQKRLREEAEQQRREEAIAKEKQEMEKIRQELLDLKMTEEARMKELQEMEKSGQEQMERLQREAALLRKRQEEEKVRKEKFEMQIREEALMREKQDREEESRRRLAEITERFDESRKEDKKKEKKTFFGKALKVVKRIVSFPIRLLFGV